jgi:hypothetical protein
VAETFILPERISRFRCRAACPRCGREADVSGRTWLDAERAAVALLKHRCACPHYPRFLVDQTPRGYALYFDGLGGRNRVHLHAGRVFGPYGELSPGGLPLSLVTADHPPPDTGENAFARREWLKAVAKVADRFRRKGFWVRVHHGSPEAEGDLRGPIAPAPRKRKKKAKVAG